MNESVLDSSALLAVLLGEVGADRVASALPGAIMSAANLAEVITKLADYGMPVVEAERAVGETGVSIVDLDIDQAVEIGALRKLTRPLGLSLGDRACLALGRRLGRTIVTADAAWTKLEGFDVRLIRGDVH